MSNRTIAVWDIENINKNYINEINNSFFKTPEIKYVISKQIISKKQINLLEKKGFIYINTKLIADIAILELLNFYYEKVDNFIIVSSDSDFVPFVKKCIGNNKKVQWILEEGKQHRIVMNSNLLKKNNIFSLLNKKTKSKRKYINVGANTSSRKYGELSLSSLLNLEDKECLCSVGNAKPVDTRKTLEERNDWICNSIISRIKQFNEKRNLDVCSSCGSKEMVHIKRNDIKLCLDCESNLVSNLRNKLLFPTKNSTKFIKNHLFNDLINKNKKKLIY